MKLGHLQIDQPALEALCARWQIVRLEAFGSVLRDDFAKNSDVDLLVSYREGYHPTLVDLLAMQDEFKTLIGREVDLVEPRLLKWVIRDRVMQEAHVVYAA